MRLFDELELVFSMMRRGGVEFALSTCKILVDGYSSCGKIDEAEEIIVEMHDQGLKVDAYLYAPVLKARCRLSKEDGLALFGKMVELGVSLNSDVFKTLLDVVCREGDVEKAKELMAEMGEKGLELDEAMLSSLIVAFCEKGLVDDAVELFNKMKSKGLNSSCRLCTTLASRLCEFGRTGDAKRLANFMIKHGMANKMFGLAALGDKIGFCGKNISASIKNDDTLFAEHFTLEEHL